MSQKKKEPQQPAEEKIEQETPGCEKPSEPDPVEEKLQQAEEQVLALNDKLLRTLAEYDNFRKRSVKEKEAIYPEAAAEAVAKFLPVLDSMERAAGFACSDEEYKKGVMHIEDENLGAGVIAQVFQKGYRLGDRVIRHTMVQVAN